MVTIYDVALYAGIIAGVAYLYKRGKGKIAGVKTPIVGLAAAALLVVAFLGGAFAPLLAALSVSPTAGPSAADLYRVTMSAVGMETLATDTSVVASDGHSAKIFDTAANFNAAAEYDLLMTGNIVNANTGSSTDVHAFSASIVSVPSVLISGVQQPWADKDPTDATLWLVTWTKGGSLSGGQVQDHFDGSMVTGASGTLAMALELNEAATSFASGQTYTFGFTEGGISLSIEVIMS